MTRGVIYTFYSFKGGVGRSMALANLGERLHEKGLRVLMVDWDLEAPGLESYFHPSDPTREGLTAARAHLGLLDMLLKYKQAFPEWSQRRRASLVRTADFTPEDEKSNAEAIQQALQKANVPAFLRNTPELAEPPAFPEFLAELYRAPSSPSALEGDLAPVGDSPLLPFLQCVRRPDSGVNGLYLFSAGARPEDRFNQYAQNVQEFDWAELYASYDGKKYFTWFREQLLSVADVVLIDSRTGVTEMGGVCTRHIPDVVVSFCAPNTQNVDGVARVIAGLNGSELKRAREERAVDVMVIPTRIDDTESDRLDDFSRLFNAQFERPELVPDALRSVERALWHLQIPYIPRYNYREETVIGPGALSRDPATQKLIDAYRKIAVYLAALSPVGSRIDNAFAGEINREFQRLRKSTVQMAPPVPYGWVERRHEVRILKERLQSSAGLAGAQRIAVCGPAGYGKSSLVARVCRDPDITAAYPDGVLWMSADRRWTGEAVQDWFRTTFAGSRLAREALRETLRGQRFILVIDDVWDLSDVSELLQYGDRCAQILITRDDAVAAEFTNRVVRVGLLTDEQSSQMLDESPFPLGTPNRSSAAIGREFLGSALGAAVIGRELERQVARGKQRPEAVESLRISFALHGLAAFDRLVSSGTRPITARIQETLSRLNSVERTLLLRVAKAQSLQIAAGSGSAEPLEFASSWVDVAKEDQGPLSRLESLSLVRTHEAINGNQQAQLPPLIYGYFASMGEIEDLGPMAAGSRDQATRDSDIDRARRILVERATATWEEMQKLAGQLKAARQFGYARRLLALARKDAAVPDQPVDIKLRLARQHALCTYRDLDLPAEQRFSDAFRILNEGDLRSEHPGAETLGLAGAVFKNRWKYGGLRRDLEQSLTYYSLGADRGVEHDFGYTAINAAYMSDALAQAEKAASPKFADARRQYAQALRRKICAELPAFAADERYSSVKGNWWYYATLAEAAFGLCNYSEARYWLREGLALSPLEWELESFTRQLAALAIAQERSLSTDAEALGLFRLIVGDAATKVGALAFGKVGLALSGGGFRASLFHIGVLARMAELDMLRHVEVLSCVSGGSIIGAHYYLEVRNLLSTKPDAEVTREDYIEIVRRVADNFETGIRKNLRTRLFASWLANARSLLQPAYTRTTLLGDFFERYLYSSAEDRHKGPLWLNKLLVQPPGAPPHFNPKVDNWRRAAKVPILLLNATTLNTGHNWQFAVSWMGEPPLGTSSAVDRNDVFRRLYYSQAPQRYQRIRLGRAVAASACVPALFDPVELSGLFPSTSIQLVDGGVHDNQGIAGLIEQECSVMIVSDASGQSNTESHPSSELPAVALRSNDILMGRVREAEFAEVDLLNRSSALGGFSFLHLKKDLQSRQLDWIGCEDPYEAGQETQPEKPSSTVASNATYYGMPRTVQARLAALRTDLDSFSEMESHALMLSGYRMATADFAENLKQWPSKADGNHPWRFLGIASAVAGSPGFEEEHARLVKSLSVGASRGFKVFRLSPYLSSTLSILLAATLGWLTWLLITLWNLPFQSIVNFALALLALTLSTGAILWSSHRLSGSRKTVSVIATGLVLTTVGWPIARLYLMLFDWLFLRAGKLRRSDSKAAP